MNLCLGGEIGFTAEQLSKGGKNGGPAALRILQKRHCERVLNDLDYKEKVYTKIAKSKNKKYGSKNAWIR